MAVLSLFSPFSPTLWNVVPRDLRPSAEYILGTDSNGQDIFWQCSRCAISIISLISALVSR
jgi:peptide/nickel transport system permease protein